MITIDNQLYYIDLQAIEDYVFQKDDINKEPIIPEVEEIVNERGAIQQTSILKKAPNTDKYTQIRYDLIKNMLEMAYNSGVQSTDGDITYIQNMDENSIGAKLIFNTLIVNGFVKDKLE